MAAPSYTTDLADVHTLETTPTFGEMVGYTASGTGSIDTDYEIQGNQHASAAMSKTGLGSLMVDYGSNLTWTSGDYVFMWAVFLPAGAVDTYANGGLRFLLGTDITTNYNGWKIGGSDFGRYPYGGWQCFAINPETTADYSGGTLAGYRWFGLGVNTIAAISKGNPIGVDAIRYGRGELIVTDGDLANGYATFTGMATQNDTSTNRWGLFQSTAGSYLWKGLMSLGTSGTAVDFRDANRVIVVEDQRPISSNFNRVEVNNAASRVDWTSIGITSLNTVSKGQFEAIANADINISACSFIDMDTFVFQSNSTILTTTFRRCGLVTAGGATFTNCLFADSTAAASLVIADLDLVTESEFFSDGSNHAVDLGTISTTDSMQWKNFLTGYAVVDGSTGNEAIKVTINSPNVLTINVPSGYSTPSVFKTGTGTVTVVNSIPITIRVKNESGVPISGAYVYLDEDDQSGYIINTTTNASGIATGSHVPGGSIRVPQETTSWSDTSITFNVNRGDIPLGTAYVVVRHADGTASTPFAITIT